MQTFRFCKDRIENVDYKDVMESTYSIRSLQKMQTFRFCFFCQAFSSFSFLGGRFFVLGGIQWRLLV